MVNKTTKITIEANIPEKQFMESILNMKFSGYEVMFPLSLYALAHSWNINKLSYYLKLLKIGKECEDDI